MKISVIITCLLTGSLLQAQSLYNSGMVSISAGTILFVKDSLVNNGTIVNNGDMQVGGAWLNNNQYDAGQGQITFNSDLPQVINHNDQSFSKLTITGGGEKIFQADITIEDKLDLDEGVLVSENGARIIIGSSAQVTGGSDQSHIKGPVYQKGSGDKIFPVGNGTIYLPVEFTNVEGDTAEVGIHEIDLDGIVLQRNNSLDNISTSRYWEVDVASGSLANSKAILPVRDEDIVTDATQVVVAQAGDPSGNFESLGQDFYDGSFDNGKVTSHNFISLPFLAIGMVKDDGSIAVYNAVSPNNDGLNDFLHIQNIENFPHNTVSLFNRWGDKVFEMAGYDNKEKVFRGKRNTGGHDDDLSAGTYFYVIVKDKDASPVTGYLSLKK